VDSDADDDDDAPGVDGSGLFDEGLVPLLMGLPGDLQTSASMLYDDEVGVNFMLLGVRTYTWVQSPSQMVRATLNGTQSYVCDVRLVFFCADLCLFGLVTCRR
jgi:hypothetical protein